jgi:hypothetical protein
MSYVTLEKILMEARKVRPYGLFELAHGKGASEPAFSAALPTRVVGPVQEIPPRISRSDL